MGCGESGIGTDSHFKGGVMFSSGISQRVAGHPRYGLPEHPHAQEIGRTRQLLGHELISIYSNNRPNGFWANHDATGSGPMALVGVKLSF